MALKLYYTLVSPFARAVLMTARELDLKIEHVEVDVINKKQFSSEFLALNPNHTVPVLQDGDYVLPESGAIMCYLVNRFKPGHSLYPIDAQLRGQVDRWLDFVIDGLAPVQRAVHRPLMYGDAIEPSKEAISAYSEKVSVIDQGLSNKKYFVGNKRTLADLDMLCLIKGGDIINFDFKTFPNVHNWMERLKHELPYHEELVEKPTVLWKNVIASRVAAKKLQRK